MRVLGGNLKRRKEKLFIMSYLLPTLLIYLVFCVFPYIKAFYMSLFKWSGFSKNKEFIGINNFVNIFHDGIVLKALKNNLFILFWCTLLTFTISLFFAVILTRKNYRENKAFQIIYFVPYVLSMSVVSILWMFIYNPSFGILNSFLKSLGLENLTRIWLGDSNVIMGALTVPLVWMNIGYFMILFIAAILNISEDVFEASSIDGANELQKLWFVTLPSIWETVRVSLVFFIVTAFNYSFELVYVITKGGPNRASELLTTYLYENAFVKSDFGYASAIGLVLFAIVFVITYLVLNLTKSRED